MADPIAIQVDLSASSGKLSGATGKLNGISGKSNGASVKVGGASGKTVSAAVKGAGGSRNNFAVALNAAADKSETQNADKPENDTTQQMSLLASLAFMPNAAVNGAVSAVPASSNGAEVRSQNSADALPAANVQNLAAADSLLQAGGLTNLVTTAAKGSNATGDAGMNGNHAVHANAAGNAGKILSLLQKTSAMNAGTPVMQLQSDAAVNGKQTQQESSEQKAILNLLMSANRASSGGANSQPLSGADVNSKLVAATLINQPLSAAKGTVSPLSPLNQPAVSSDNGDGGSGSSASGLAMVHAVKDMVQNPEVTTVSTAALMTASNQAQATAQTGKATVANTGEEAVKLVKPQGQIAAEVLTVESKNGKNAALLAHDDSMPTGKNAQNGVVASTGTDSFAEVLLQQTPHTTSQLADTGGLSSDISGQKLADPYAVVSQIVDKASLVSGKQNSEMVIQLKPDHLGELTLKVSVDSGGVVSASFHSDNPDVRNAIQAAIPQLKQDMSAQGLKVDNVGVYAGMGQAFSEGQRQTYQPQPQIKMSNPQNEKEFVEALEAVNQSQPVQLADGVDYRV
jgi:flagellar hook-length control protein FliK